MYTASDWHRNSLENTIFLKYSPVTKLIILTLTSFTFFVNVFQLENKFNMPTTGLTPFIIPNFQLWRLFSHQLYVASSCELLLSVILLYYLRLIEMRVGTVKFLSNLVMTSIISILFQVGIQVILPMKNTIGPSELLTSLMIFYYKYVPHYQQIRFFRFNLTNKCYLYILFIQFLLINFMSNILSVICGILSTIVFHSPNFPFQKFRVPNCIINFISRHIIDLNLFDSSQSYNLLQYGYSGRNHISNQSNNHSRPQFSSSSSSLSRRSSSLLSLNNNNSNNNNNYNNQSNILLNNQLNANDANNNGWGEFFPIGNFSGLSINPNIYANIPNNNSHHHDDHYHDNFDFNNIGNSHIHDDEIQVEERLIDPFANHYHHQANNNNNNNENNNDLSYRYNPYLFNDNIKTLQNLFGLSKEECALALQQTGNDIELASSIILSAYDDNIQY